MSIAERVTGHLHPVLGALKASLPDERAFWERMAVGRTPLIEPDAARPGHSLVTYVFPLPEGAQHVVVEGGGFGQASESVMDRVVGTNVCHICYRYRDDVRLTYQFRPDMPLVVYEQASEAEWRARQDDARKIAALPDPHAREIFTCPASGRPDIVRSILSLPDSPDHATVESRPDVPHGRVDSHKLTSIGLRGERRIWVYTPPGYEPADGPYPMLLAFDAGSSLTVKPIPRVLDNLLAEGRVHPMVAVFVDNATAVSRFEDLHCSEPFARFIETELTPWVRERYAVSHDPADCCVTGHSAGGLAALWMGLRLPHLFGAVISQSAALWWGPGYVREKPLHLQRYTPCWLIAEYERAPPLPLRVWLEAGLMETTDRMIEPNRRMKALLEAKGYDVTYCETAGGHDPAIWGVTIAEALAIMAPAKTAVH